MKLAPEVIKFTVRETKKKDNIFYKKKDGKIPAKPRYEDCDLVEKISVGDVNMGILDNKTFRLNSKWKEVTIRIIEDNLALALTRSNSKLRVGDKIFLSNIKRQ